MVSYRHIHFHSSQVSVNRLLHKPVRRVKVGWAGRFDNRGKVIKGAIRTSEICATARIQKAQTGGVQLGGVGLLSGWSGRLNRTRSHSLVELGVHLAARLVDRANDTHRVVKTQITQDSNDYQSRLTVQPARGLYVYMWVPGYVCNCSCGVSHLLLHSLRHKIIAWAER